MSGKAISENGQGCGYHKKRQCLTCKELLGITVISGGQAVVTNISIDELKGFLQGRLDLEEFEKVLPMLKRLYGSNLAKIQGLPEDVVHLALSNECAVTDYVDFHAKGKISQVCSRYDRVTRRLRKSKDQ